MTFDKVNAAIRTGYRGHLPALQRRDISTGYLVGFKQSLSEDNRVRRQDRVWMLVFVKQKQIKCLCPLGRGTSPKLCSMSGCVYGAAGDRSGSCTSAAIFPLFIAPR